MLSKVLRDLCYEEELHEVDLAQLRSFGVEQRILWLDLDRWLEQYERFGPGLRPSSSTEYMSSYEELFPSERGAKAFSSMPDAVWNEDYRKRGSGVFDFPLLPPCPPRVPYKDRSKKATKLPPPQSGCSRPPST